MNYLVEELGLLETENPDIHKFIKSSDVQGYWIWNLNNVTERWYAPEFWGRLGYNVSDNIDSLTFWHKVMVTEDITYCYDNLANYMKNPVRDFEQLVRYKHKNGDIEWIKCIGKVLYNQNGQPDRMLGVTLAKERIQTLQIYKDLLEQTNEVARIGHWDLNLETNEAFWSKVTKQIHEVPDDFECSREMAISFYKGESREIISKLFRNAIENGVKYDVEIQITTYKNNKKWIRAIGIPEMKNGVCHRIYGLAQDIDKEKRSQKDIEHKEELFRSTFENASIGMALVGLNGEWLRVNNSLCNILGYDKEEFYKLTFQDITHPADLNIDLDQVTYLIEGKGDSYQMEKRYFHKNGDIVWALLAVSIIRNSKGKPIHFVSQITDITKRKAALTKVESLLEITQNQNKRLLNFAHIVSHNLRSHSGNLSMLMDLMKLEMPAFTKNEFFDMINQAVGNLSETIKHLNEVILVHAQQRDDIKSVNLNDFTVKAISSLSAIARENKAVIENNVDTSIHVNYVCAYLDSILINLLSNAIKYKDPNKNLHIKLTTEHEDDFYVLNIQDNGLGIDLKSHSNKLFGMYKTFHENPEARGIGLFITKNQIEAMEGKIKVESAVGQGSTFKVYFKK